MQKLNIPCINTGDFAKLCNTNKRTLIHYHNIGLFIPALIDEKGYRFYSESQCDIFSTITYLKDLGMPLQEIAFYIDNRTIGEMKDLLLKQKEKVAKELAHLQRIQDVIHTKLNLIQLSETSRIADHPSDITVDYVEEEYYVISDVLDTDQHQEIFQNLCQHLQICNTSNYSYGYNYGAVQSTADLFSGKWDYYHFFITKTKNQVFTSPSLVKPAGHYITTYLVGDYYNINQVYQRLLDYIDSNHLQVGPFIYKEAIVEEVLTTDINSYITKLSILVQ